MHLLLISILSLFSQSQTYVYRLESYLILISNDNENYSALSGTLFLTHEIETIEEFEIKFSNSISKVHTRSFTLENQALTTLLENKSLRIRSLRLQINETGVNVTDIRNFKSLAGFALFNDKVVLTTEENYSINSFQLSNGRESVHLAENMSIVGKQIQEIPLNRFDFGGVDPGTFLSYGRERGGFYLLIISSGNENLSFAQNQAFGQSSNENSFEFIENSTQVIVTDNLGLVDENTSAAILKNVENGMFFRLVGGIFNKSMRNFAFSIENNNEINKTAVYQVIIGKITVDLQSNAESNTSQFTVQRKEKELIVQTNTPINGTFSLFSGAKSAIFRFKCENCTRFALKVDPSFDEHISKYGLLLLGNNSYYQYTSVDSVIGEFNSLSACSKAWSWGEITLLVLGILVLLVVIVVVVLFIVQRHARRSQTLYKKLQQE